MAVLSDGTEYIIYYEMPKKQQLKLSPEPSPLYFGYSVGLVIFDYSPFSSAAPIVAIDVSAVITFALATLAIEPPETAISPVSPL